MIYPIKRKYKMMPKGVFKYIIYIFFISLMIILSFQTFTIASPDVTLGSGVNITANTLIKLTGLNCNLTLADDHIVDKLEVHSDYILINASLNAPTWIEGSPYIYSQAQQAIYIKCCQNTEKTLYINTSNLGDGIKVYGVSGEAYLTSVSWSEANKEFKLTVDSSLAGSMTEVYWPYPSKPISSCNPPGSGGAGWDSVNKIVTLTSDHSSPVEWTLSVQSESNPPQWSNLYHEPSTIITTLDPVTIKVTWEDDTGLGSAIIWENSTGEWQGHVVHS